MEGARDWRLMVDLDGKLKVPGNIVETELRPDMLLISQATKRMGVIELTVPSEERVEVSGELKKSKYAVLQQEGKKNGWGVQIWAVEVGCRGFPAASMATFMKDIWSDRSREKEKAQESGRGSREGKQVAVDLQQNQGMGEVR